MSSGSSNTGRGRSQPIPLLLADDYPLLRAAIRATLECEPGLTVCGTAGTPEETLQSIDSLQPSVALVALSLTPAELCRLAEEIQQRDVPPAMLVLSATNDPALVQHVIHSGARGFLARADAAESLVEAIHSVAEGQTYVGRKAAANVVDQMLVPGVAHAPVADHGFTPREREILELIGGGLTPREIAQQLRLSVKTIESHRENIRQKLGVGSAAKVARHAFQWIQGRNAG